MTLERRAAHARAFVVHPRLGLVQNRDEEAALAEGMGLARAIDLDLVGGEIVPLRAPKPSTLLGGGHVARLAEMVEDQELGLIIVDAHLTPVQQRNLEKALDCKVIDRTGLILEIFGARAQTKEGRLQVELAHLSYQRSRLVRSWTHLERQRGGFGFIGGPGESQIEIDRRLIDERIARLKKDLAKVRKTRGLHRSARKKIPVPLVALVGYTNAGKSTLFNALTQENVRAQDLLFATLDPTMRRLKLPGGREAVLSDTVGFITALPTQLVEAFRATLEEVQEADLILHVRDISHPETALQKTAVETTLADLGIDCGPEGHVLEVWNKLDAVSAPERAGLAERAQAAGALACSALAREGLVPLLAALEKALEARWKTLRIVLKHEDGEALALLYRLGQVLETKSEKNRTRVVVRLSDQALGQLHSLRPALKPEAL